VAAPLKHILACTVGSALEFAVAGSVNVILRHGLHWGRC